jgi:signal transduction histidine kinase
MVQVSVEDSGMGVSTAARERIFNPLFTTKASGMGMGLSICRSIIENHDGKIWVSEAAGRGSIFQFELPAADSGMRSSSPAPTGSGSTVNHREARPPANSATRLAAL